MSLHRSRPLRRLRDRRRRNRRLPVSTSSTSRHPAALADSAQNRGTEDAAVARQGPQQCVAGRALEVPLARIGRHRLGQRRVAVGAGDCRLALHRYAPPNQRRKARLVRSTDFRPT
jgi:hypothetical protein